METNEIYDVSAQLDAMFGAPGTQPRKEAEDEAWQEYDADSSVMTIELKQCL